MDVPAILNMPTGGADLKASNSTGSSGRGFSDHLDSNVNRIKSERNEASVRSLKNNERLDTKRSVADAKEVKESAAQAKDDVENVAATEDSSLNDDKLHALSTETSAPADKQGFASMSGNELPQAADIEEINAQLNDLDKEIMFDPLGQSKESSAHIAAIAAGNLAATDKRLDGKNNATDLFNASNIALSLNKSNNSEVSDVVLERLQKPLDGAANLVKELGSTNKAAADGVPFNTALLNAGAQQQAALLPAAADKPTIQLDTSMSNPRWGENFNQKVQWVVSQSMSGAQIRLNPQHMGPIEVRIQMQNDQATVSFTAQHGATREAIDAALPRLREMFSEQNVNVGDIDVSQHSFAEQRDQQAANNGEGNDGFFDSLDRDDDSMLDQQASEQQRKYSGLFSGFA